MRRNNFVSSAKLRILNIIFKSEPLKAFKHQKRAEVQEYYPEGHSIYFLFQIKQCPKYGALRSILLIGFNPTNERRRKIKQCKFQNKHSMINFIECFTEVNYNPPVIGFNVNFVYSRQFRRWRVPFAFFKISHSPG